MNPNCARCGKIVYPTEKVNCLDKVSSGTRRRGLGSPSAAPSLGRKGTGCLRALPRDPLSREGRREVTWGAGTDPSLQPGKSKARRWAATAREGWALCLGTGKTGRAGGRAPGNQDRPGVCWRLEVQSRPPRAGNERGDGRSLSPRRPAPSRRKRGALGEGAAGAGQRLGPALPSGLRLLVAQLPGLEAVSGPSLPIVVKGA